MFLLELPETSRLPTNFYTTKTLLQPEERKLLVFFSYKNMFMSANYSHESLHFKRVHELESLATKSQRHVVLFVPLIKKGKNTKKSSYIHP